MMRIVYMGTPEFAVPSLEAAARNHCVVGVVTQTDKPAGRGKRLTFSPVKTKALELNIPLLQPDNVNDESSVEWIRSLKPDVIVVVAYGQILRQPLLEIPLKGCINVHGSLLPRLRGAAPIQFALLQGFNETGVTTMYMAKGLDSGDMIAKKAITIEESHTAGVLHDKLMHLGAELLTETLEAVEEGSAKREVQNASDATFCSLINKEMARIDWSKSAVEIHRMVRAFDPWPVAFTHMGDKNIKVFEVQCLDLVNSHDLPGVILDVSPKGIDVQTGEGVIRLLSIQFPASKRMTVQAFLLGHTIKIGTHLGV